MRYYLTILLCFASLWVSAQDDDFYAQGVEFAKKGDYINARAQFDIQTKKTPMDPYAWFNLALTESYLNKNQESVTHFTKAIELKKDYYKAFYNRALVKIDMTRYEEALEDLNQSILIKEDYDKGYLKRAVVLEYLDKSKEACADVKKAKKLKNKRAEYLERTICKKKRAKNYANILYLKKHAPDTTYGYNSKYPIKVGNGVYGGPGNQRAYLNLLRDKEGNPVSYNRQGSCCPYESKNGFMGSAMVDRYEVTYKENGQEKKCILFISFYDYEEPMIPEGFNTVE